MTTATQPQLRSLDYYEKDGIQQLCFNDTLKPARAVPLGGVVKIIWNDVEGNAPEGADAWRMIGEPRRRLGWRGETALIQYYKLNNN